MFESIRDFKINGLTVLFASFLIFLIWICPTIYAGDTSLFAAASFSLGSTHPPGYPLFVILGKLLTFLPFGNVALKVNLVSALAGALACLMVFKTSVELTESRPASWAAAMVCAISPIFFSASLIAKGGAYTLNSFFAMCIFYLGIRIIRGKDVFRNSLMAFFLIGLGMGNHHTIGFMGLIILVPLAIRWRDLSLKWAASAFVFFSLGFSIYLLLYFRSMAITDHGGLILYSYGGTLKDFLGIFLRREYKGSSTPQTLEHTFSFGSVWLHGLRNSLYYVAYRSLKPIIVFLLLGLAGLKKRYKLLVYFIFSGFVWFLLLGRLVFPASKPSTEDFQIVSVYFLPAVTILYSLVGVGFAETLSFVRKKQWSMLAGFSSYALAVLPFVFLPYTVGQYALSGNVVCYDYGRDMLMSLPEKSLLMNHGDNPMFTAFYMKSVERLREDVLVMDTAGRKGIFGLEVAQPWKYARLYPDFYHSEKSTIKEISSEFAVKGKLFVDNPLNMTNVVTRYYDYYPYLFSAALRPKTLPSEGFDSDVRRRFKRAFKMTNYESILAMPVSDDFLVRELTDEYGLNTLLYSDIIMREGNLKGAAVFRKLAFTMARPEKILWPYVNFLLKDGRKNEALGLLAGLEKTEGYGRLAHLLEEKAVSAIQNR